MAKFFGLTEKIRLSKEMIVVFIRTEIGDQSHHVTQIVHAAHLKLQIDRKCVTKSFVRLTYGETESSDVESNGRIFTFDESEQRFQQVATLFTTFLPK